MPKLPPRTTTTTVTAAAAPAFASLPDDNDDDPDLLDVMLVVDNRTMTNAWPIARLTATMAWGDRKPAARKQVPWGIFRYVHSPFSA